MYFCQDVDLLPWEPGIFLETKFAHQAIIKNATATLTGTALVTDDPVLAVAMPGMVVQVNLLDDSLAQLLEIVTITDSTHATVSALRGRGSEDAVPALAGGSVKVTIVTFHPQIAAVGDALLGLVGVASDRDTDPLPASTALLGFKPAAIFATLAAIFRTIADTKSATTIALRKLAFYEGLAHASRHTLAATIDHDGDGVPDTRVLSGVASLERV